LILSYEKVKFRCHLWFERTLKLIIELFFDLMFMICLDGKTYFGFAFSIWIFASKFSPKRIFYASWRWKVKNYEKKYGSPRIQHIWSIKNHIYCSKTVFIGFWWMHFYVDMKHLVVVVHLIMAVSHWGSYQNALPISNQNKIAKFSIHIWKYDRIFSELSSGKILNILVANIFLKSCSTRRWEIGWTPKPRNIE